MNNQNESKSLYLGAGRIIVIINAICAAISFLVVWVNGGLLWAVLTVVGYAISTFVTAIPFFALHEAFDKIEKLELSVYGYRRTQVTERKEYKQHKKEYESNFSEDEELLFRDEYRYGDSKRLLDDGKWVCSCGKVRANYESVCNCGEQRPRVGKKKLLNNGLWVCSCGKTRESYVEVCDCGEEKPLKTITGWKCSCGKENPDYIGTCSCGTTKPR